MTDPEARFQYHWMIVNKVFNHKDAIPPERCSQPLSTWLVEKLTSNWSKLDSSPRVEWLVYNGDVDASGRIHIMSDASGDWMEVIDHAIATIKSDSRDLDRDLFYLTNPTGSVVVSLSTSEYSNTPTHLVLAFDEDFALRLGGGHETSFYESLCVACRAFFFSESLAGTRTELRRWIEESLRIRPERVAPPHGAGPAPRSSGRSQREPNLDEVLWYFDLLEWFKDGKRRIREEHWKSHVAIQRILQPDATPHSRQEWWVNTRLGSPEVMAERMLLGIPGPLTDPRIEEVESQRRRNRAPFPPCEDLEYAINLWLWAYKALSQRGELPACFWDVLQLARDKAHDALPFDALGAGEEVKIRGSWSRRRFAHLLLDYYNNIGLTQPPPFTIQDLCYVVLDALYEARRTKVSEEKDDEDCSPDKRTQIPHLPCDHSKYTDALIRMVDCYAHEVVGIPYDIPVGVMLRSMFDREGVFYLVMEGYRNHLYHVIDVCMLGEVVGPAIGLLDLHTQESRRWWWLASLFHDVGYLAETIRFTSGYLGALRGEVFREARGHIDQAIKDARDRIRAWPDEEWAEIIGTRVANHGTFGAIHLVEQLTELHLDPMSFREVVLAIAAHTDDQRFLDWEQHPIAVLLALCDELQEWQRASAHLGDIQRAVAAFSMFPGTYSGWRSELETLTLSHQGTVLSVELAYWPAAGSSLNPIRIWLDKVKNLERLRPPANHDIHLEMTFKPASGATRPGERSPSGLAIDRLLQSVDSEPRLVRLRRFGWELRREAQGCVSHDDSQGVDRFKFDLQKLHANLAPVTGGAQTARFLLPRGREFGKALKAWFPDPPSASGG